MSNFETNIPQKEEVSKVPKPKKLIGARHYQCLLMFITNLINFSLRTSLSVAIISMTDETPPDPSVPTYPDWNNSDIILSSFFWGYIVTQVGAGQLSEYFGPKWYLVGTLILNSLLNIAIPSVAAAFGSTGVIICRVLQGLNQGFLAPCVLNLISRWTPIYERARITNFVCGGISLGIAIGMVLTGSLCGSKFGWPAAFYTHGGLAIAWAIIFGIFAQNSPSSHKTISEEERKYIESTTSIRTTVKKVPTPWISILTSVPMWAIFVSGIAQCFGGFILLTEIPSYMDGILNFNISSNSQLSALPYVAQFFMSLIASPLFDRIVANKTISITAARKISNSIASFMPAAALVSLAFLENFRKELVTVLLIVAVGTTACFNSGYILNVIDIAPNHAGTLFGIINSSNTIFSILGPLTVGLLGSDKKDPILWRKVFLLSAGVNTACGIFYVAFTTAEVQPWNDKEKNSTGNDKNSEEL